MKNVDERLLSYKGMEYYKMMTVHDEWNLKRCINISVEIIYSMKGIK